MLSLWLAVHALLDHLHLPRTHAGAVAEAVGDAGEAAAALLSGAGGALTESVSDLTSSVTGITDSLTSSVTGGVGAVADSAGQAVEVGALGCA